LLEPRNFRRILITLIAVGLFCQFNQVYYENGSNIRFFPIYIIQQQQHEKKEQNRKRKRNEKKHLKDLISNFLSCGGFGCCCSGGCLVKKGRLSLLSMQKRS
jgi:hypothetical protein